MASKVNGMYSDGACRIGDRDARSRMRSEHPKGRVRSRRRGCLARRQSHEGSARATGDACLGSGRDHGWRQGVFSRTQRPLAAVVDVNLRGEMAWGLIDELREQGVEVVVMSGYALPDTSRGQVADLLAEAVRRSGAHGGSLCDRWQERLTEPPSAAHGSRMSNGCDSKPKCPPFGVKPRQRWTYGHAGQ